MQPVAISAEELWKEACAAAKRLGACRVARALGVKYDTLRQRVLAGGAGARGEAMVQPSGTQFIELTGFSAASRAVTGDEAVVEVLAADGARLTSRLKGAGLDIPALVNAFRGRS